MVRITTKKKANLATRLALSALISISSAAYSNADQSRNQEFRNNSTSCSIDDTVDESAISVPITESRFTTEGKFLRTYRWDNVISRVEELHGMPKGCLAGLAMVEGRGDPVSLNSTDDGGAGLYNCMPGTASDYGLKTFDGCMSTSADKKHGKGLRELVKKHNYNLGRLSRLDERFDWRKSTYAMGRMLADLRSRYGSWEKAVSAFNQGTPAGNPGATQHVRYWKKYMDYYSERKEQVRSTGSFKMPGIHQNPREEQKDPYEEQMIFKGEVAPSTDVFRYIVRPGENAYVLAERFDLWDDNSRDKYENLTYRDVKDHLGNFVGDRIMPNQPVYIIAEKKSGK